MKFDALLRAHGFMRVERPLEIWEAETEDVRFVPVLGEMISIGLTRGNDLSALTLNVSNVVVDRDAAGAVPQGEYVAVSVSGSGDWAPEWSWRIREGAGPTKYRDFASAALKSGAVYAYCRDMGGNGSITVFLPRALRQHVWSILLLDCNTSVLTAPLLTRLFA